MYQKLKVFFHNPFTIISSLILGMGVGLYLPDIGVAVAPYGDIYMSLLEMSLIPIIITAIALSISRLMSFKHEEMHAGKIIAVLILMMLLVSFISTLLGYFQNPAAGIISAENFKLKEISIAASFVDKTMENPIFEAVQKGMVHFISQSIPNNIFRAFADSRTFQILIFSIILGVSVAYLKDNEREKSQNFFSTALMIFQKIIIGITVWLPIAVFCLMAGSVSSVGIETLTQMGSFIFKIYVIYFVIFLISTMIISFKTKTSFVKTVSNLKEPIFIAFGTRSAIVPIPSIIGVFENKFNLDSSLTKLLVPIGAILGRFGNIVYFAFLAIFVAGIYHFDITFGTFFLIVALSALSGLSTVGTTGILTLGLVTIVLDPLGLPIGAVLPILIAIDTIVDPMRTLTSVYSNCAVVSLLAPKVKGEEKKDKILAT